jgi:hypothetical protein
MINDINHVFDCSSGKVNDLIIAPTRDAAESKFRVRNITTISGKDIKVQVQFLFTIPQDNK